MDVVMVSMRIVDHVKGHFPTEVFGIASKKYITDFKENIFFFGVQIQCLVTSFTMSLFDKLKLTSSSRS